MAAAEREAKDVSAAVNYSVDSTGCLQRLAIAALRRITCRERPRAHCHAHVHGLASHLGRHAAVVPDFLFTDRKQKDLA